MEHNEEDKTIREIHTVYCEQLENMIWSGSCSGAYIYPESEQEKADRLKREASFSYRWRNSWIVTRWHKFIYRMNMIWIAITDINRLDKDVDHDY